MGLNGYQASLPCIKSLGLVAIGLKIGKEVEVIVASHAGDKNDPREQ